VARQATRSWFLYFFKESLCLYSGWYIQVHLKFRSSVLLFNLFIGTSGSLTQIPSSQTPTCMHSASAFTEMKLSFQGRRHLEENLKTMDERRSDVFLLSAERDGIIAVESRMMTVRWKHLQQRGEYLLSSLEQSDVLQELAYYQDTVLWVWSESVSSRS